MRAVRQGSWFSVLIPFSRLEIIQQTKGTKHNFQKVSTFAAFPSHARGTLIKLVTSGAFPGRKWKEIASNHSTCAQEDQKRIKKKRCAR